MDKKTELELRQVLKNNSKHPLVVAGDVHIDFKDFTSLDAKMDERELHIPANWHNLLESKAQNKKNYLLISGLDTVEYRQQEIFVSLLKDRRAGNFKLPENIQIIIPVADKNKLSPRILSLVLVWDVE